MQETKKFGTSDLDFVAYLKTIGIDYNNIRKNNNNKISFEFNYDYREMIKLKDKFLNENIEINMNNYRAEKALLINIVKSM